ncbi:MAG: helix-turn-helix transcriptional regulator [Chloroflexota bacterium]
MFAHPLPNFTTAVLKNETDRPIEWFAHPSPILKPYILGYRGLIMPTGLPTSFTQLVAPSGMAMLYIIFGRHSTTEVTFPDTEMEAEVSRPSQALILPRQRQWGARVSAAADVVGVVFRPGMLTPFLNLSLHEFDDEWIKPAELWMHTPSNQLADIESLSPKARIAAIETVLIDRLQKSCLDVDPLIQRVVDSIIGCRGNVSLEVVAKTMGISPRQLRRRFHAQVGMSPKQLARIERFRHASEFASKNYPTMSLASIAQQFDYFDQAHFARDFMEFSGQTPKALALSDQHFAQNYAINLHYFEFTASS